MSRINMDDFSVFSYEDFGDTFLVERNLDKVKLPNFGELSKDASRFNKEMAKKLNKWASLIFTKVDRYVNKINKKFGSEIIVRHIKASDGKSGESAIVLIRVIRTNKIVDGEIEISVVDSNKILMHISKDIARVLKAKELHKVVSNQDRAVGYAINILERIVV